MKVINFITMGCSKNLVDSERLLFLFRQHGFEVRHNPERIEGFAAVVNTCGFIADAKQESIQMLCDVLQLKAEGVVEKVFVMGCLSERYHADLQSLLPDVDGFYGKFDFEKILSDLLPEAPACHPYRRILTTPSHYAYVKISEGCSRACAYCAIPLITGRHKSRPMEEILDEVRELAARGVKEIQIIAQELTYYGLDLTGHRELPRLVETLCGVEGIEWIRLHYAYPTDFPLELLDVMARQPKVCRYLDLALQHISDPVLKRMHRHITKAETLSLLAEIRRRVPGIVLRTTLMVGFPGETEDDFQQLLDFVRQARFERLGAFAYSEEEGTYAAQHYADDVPEDVKQDRLSRLMSEQEAISADVMQSMVGQDVRIIVDRREGDYLVGRTEGDSPDVDCEVLLRADENPTVKVGSFCNVHITSAAEFDLYATLQPEPHTSQA